MRIRGSIVIAAVLTLCALAAPARALSPYLRADYARGVLRMGDGNQLIHDNEKMFTDAGLPADFKDVGPGYGPSGSLGLWVFPAVRVGAYGAYSKGVTKNHLHVPGVIFYADDLEFRMTEIGAEAAVRFVRLAGLTFGGHVAQARAKLIEGYAWQDGYGDYFEDNTATRTRTTYGGFLGIDQTNEKGVVGYFRVGYQFRDMGEMPSHVTASDGVTTVQLETTTIPLDYSGWYAKLGIGFDLVKR